MVITERSFFNYITCYVAYFRLFFNVYVLYYVHLGYICCYVRNLFCYIFGYIGISVYYIKCYVQCYIT